MDCLDDRVVHPHGNDDIRISITLFELAQGTSQDNGKESTWKKQTSHWMDPNTDASRPYSYTTSAPVASISMQEWEMAKGKKSLRRLLDLSTPEHSFPGEISIPGAAQRRLADLGNPGQKISLLVAAQVTTASDRSSRSDTDDRTLGSLDTSGLGMGGLSINGGMSYLGSSGRVGNMNEGSCAGGSSSQSSSRPARLASPFTGFMVTHSVHTVIVRIQNAPNQL
jgi:hypothetical protein